MLKLATLVKQELFGRTFPGTGTVPLRLDFSSQVINVNVKTFYIYIEFSGDALNCLSEYMALFFCTITGLLLW